VHAVFVSLCLAAAWIDWEHLIIPDEINYVGIALGILSAAICPSLFGVERAFHAAGRAIYGAFLGFGLIWLVILAGKLAFGRARRRFEGLQAWDIAQPDPGREPRLRLAGDEFAWSDLFCRPGVDRLRIRGPWFAVDGSRHELEGELVVTMNRYSAGEIEGDLESVQRLEGEAEEVVIPREAMGLGDAKFMALIGAFLGWKGVLFSVFGGSVLATVVWLVCWVARKADRSRQIPFGPYLAAAAVVWVFAGPELLAAYANTTSGVVRELLLR
jgi:leader peptidase (prepilin peptidase)/N-methyltransferase